MMHGYPYPLNLLINPAAEHYVLLSDHSEKFIRPTQNYTTTEGKGMCDMYHSQVLGDFPS